MLVKMYKILLLLELYNRLKDKKMPLRTAYLFTILFKELDSSLEFYKTKMQAIVSLYAQYDEYGKVRMTDDGNNILLQPDKLSQCQSELNELNNLDINISNVKFKMDDLNSIEMSIAEMDSLIDFIEV